MNAELSTLRAALRAATLASFGELALRASGEWLYAFCLQTADDGMSVGPCANTREGFSEKLAIAAAEREVGDDYRAYLRWTTAEWRYEMFGDAAFAELNQTTQRMALDDTVDSPNYFAGLTEAMIDALAHLREQRGEQLVGVTLFATVTDSEETDAIEDNSARALNPPELANAFLARFGT